jgi:hypothetical protein
MVFSILFITRLILSLQMPELPLSIPRWYLPATGLFWGSIGLATCAGLFLGRPWAPQFLRWGCLGFAAWYWVDRFLFVRSDYGRGTWLAAALITLVGSILLFWFLRRADIRTFFQE